MQDYKKALNSVMKYYILWSNNGNSGKTISLLGNNGNMYNTFDMYYWQIKMIDHNTLKNSIYNTRALRGTGIVNQMCDLYEV